MVSRIIVVVAAAGAMSSLAACTAPTSGEDGAAEAAASWTHAETGERITCALDSKGRVFCWTVTSTRDPENVARPTLPAGIAALTLSGNCALTADGAAYCWDFRNDSIGLQVDVARVGPTITFKTIGGGLTAGCGIATDGRRLCWRNKGEPAALVGDPGFTTIVVSRGGQACGLTAAGAASCWSLGSEPKAVPTDLRFASISPSSSHTCALTAAGDAYCWGDNTGYQLGAPRPTSDASCTSVGPPVTMYYSYACSSPQRVIGGYRFSQIVAGNSFTCALTAEGKAYCWGFNLGRALGVESAGSEQCRIGNYADCTPTPVAVSGGKTFVRVGSTGGFHTCGMTADNSAYCWGQGNANGLPSISISIRNGNAAPVKLPDPAP